MFAWTSPYILKISKDKTNYDISEEEAAYLSIIPPISMMISCLFFAILNDVLGRKITLMLIAVPQILFLLLTIVASNIEVFSLARVFTGFGDAFFFVSLPMYVGEISTPKVRGTWGNLVMVTVFLGMFLMNIIGSYLSVMEASYLCLPLPLIFLILMLAMPESPYYCIMKNQENDARKSLKFLRGKENVEEEYKRLKIDVDRQISERGTWLDLFKIPTNRTALLAGVFLRFSQQMSGLMVFNNFAQFIFKKSGTNISSEVSSIIYSGLLFVLTVCCVYTVEKFGRKKNYMYSLLLCAIVLLALSVYFFLDYNVKMDLKKFEWFPLAGMILYIVFMSFGIGIVPTLMLGELFSASIKSKALSFITVTTGLTQFLTNKIFYVLYINFGLFAPFLMFSIASFISTLISIKVIPETKGKTLEEIQQSLNKR